MSFSTQWKTFPPFFHTMENFFPQCGKTSGREFPHGGGLRIGRVKFGLAKRFTFCHMVLV